MTQLTATKAPVIRIGGDTVTPGRAILDQHPDNGAWLLLHSRDDGPIILPEFDNDTFVRIVVADHTATEREARKAARAHLATDFDCAPIDACKVAAAILRYLHQAQRAVTSEELFFRLTDAFTFGELSGALLAFGAHFVDGDYVTVGDVTRAMLALCVNVGKWGTYTADVDFGPVYTWLECDVRNGAHRFHLMYGV
jgi:hypothetical protein